MKSFALLSALCLTGVAVDAHADAFKPSKKDQLSLGKRASKEIRSDEKIISASDRKVRMLRDVATRLLEADPTPKTDPWEFTFDLIDRPKEMNAFALPGGPIYFFTGLYDKFETEDQLAGVLAHEITHVRKEHWAYAYADRQKRALGLSLLLVLTKANKTTQNLASISNDLLLTLPNSRKAESEADDIGLKMMVKAGFNPNGIVGAFKILSGGRKGSKGPEWLSTHPDIDKRIKTLEDKIAKLDKANFREEQPMPWAGENPRSQTLSEYLGDLRSNLLNHSENFWRPSHRQPNFGSDFNDSCPICQH